MEHIPNTNTIGSQHGPRSPASKIVRGFAVSLALLPLFGGIARADCNSLQNAVAILAVDLAKHADEISRSREQVRKLTIDIQQASVAARGTLEQQKNAAERNLNHAQTQHADIVRRLAERGKLIENEVDCP